MSIKPIKLKSLLLFVGATLAVGGIGALLGGRTSEIYATLVKPPLAPPPSVFGIVWGVLYVLIGIGAYILSSEKSELVPTALKLYWAQLFFNMLWPLIFWRLELFTLAAFWLGIILILTILLIAVSAKINTAAVWLFLPYLAWLIFALYLNIGFAVLN